MKYIAIVFLLLLSGCARQEQIPSGTLDVSGRIEGDEIDLGFKMGGRIAEMLVREGDTVQPGQVLARLSGEQERIRLREAEARLRGVMVRVEQSKLSIPTIESRLAVSRLLEDQTREDVPSRVAQAEAQAAAVRADLKRAQADEEQVRLDAERYADLSAKGAAPKQMAEQYGSRLEASRAAIEALRKQAAAADAAVDVAKASLRTPGIRQGEVRTLERQVEEARAVVRLAETDVSVAAAALERARTDVKDLELTAPLAGTILTRASEPGRVIAAGVTVLTMVDLTKLYLRGFVPEGQIGLVKLGQSAEVFLDSAPQTALTAEVLRIDPRAMFTPENTYFKEDRVKQVVGVKLLLKSGGGGAKPGMPADGRIHVR